MISFARYGYKQMQLYVDVLHAGDWYFRVTSLRTPRVVAGYNLNDA